MKKWEYKVIGGRDYDSTDKMEKEINRLGLQGWKTISTNLYGNQCIFLMEREIPEPPAINSGPGKRVIGNPAKREFVEPTEIPDGEAD